MCAICNNHSRYYTRPRFILSNYTAVPLLLSLWIGVWWLSVYQSCLTAKKVLGLIFFFLYYFICVSPDMQNGLFVSSDTGPLVTLPKYRLTELMLRWAQIFNIRGRQRVWIYGWNFRRTFSLSTQKMCVLTNIFSKFMWRKGNKSSAIQEASQLIQRLGNNPRQP